MVKDLQTLRQEARDLGLVPTDEAVKGAEELNDAINRVRRVGLATAFEIGAALQPMLMPALQTVKNIAGWFNRWAKEKGTVNATPGLGDRVAMGLTAFGITRERIAWVRRMFGGSDSGCDGCDRRQQALNEVGEKLGL